MRNGPVLYSIDMAPRWVEHEAWVNPVPTGLIPPLKNNSHRPSLFILRDNSTLYRHDIDTGVLYEKVFLARDRKFVGMTCDFESSRIYIRSSPPKRVYPGIKDIVMSIVVLQYPPLQFVGQFEIRKSIFGGKITGAEVSQNLLLVMDRDWGISIYSLEYILEKVNQI